MGGYPDYRGVEQAIVNMHFLLRVESKYDLPCKSIHGMQAEREYEYIQEGGLNDYVHIRPKPVSKPGTLRIERYIDKDYFDPLALGTVLESPVMLLISEKTGDFVSPSLTVTFWGCTVTDKSYADLDAEKSGLMVETTTIAYQQMKFQKK